MENVTNGVKMEDPCTCTWKISRRLEARESSAS